jgi:hypothetical protein
MPIYNLGIQDNLMLVCTQPGLSLVHRLLELFFLKWTIRAGLPKKVKSGHIYSDVGKFDVVPNKFIVVFQY